MSGLPGHAPGRADHGDADRRRPARRLRRGARSKRLFAWFREVDERFSTYKQGSEISRLNRGELALRRLPPRRARRCSPAATSSARRPAGTSTPATPRCSSVDPSGPRQGLVGRPRRRAARGGRGAATTRSTPAATSARAGRPCRSRPGGPASSIPSYRDRIAAVVEANDLALATSGAYARGRAHRRSAHRPAAERAPLGHDRGRRPRARPTPTRPRRSRWASGGRRGRRRCGPTRPSRSLPTAPPCRRRGFPWARSSRQPSLRVEPTERRQAAVTAERAAEQAGGKPRASGTARPSSRVRRAAGRRAARARRGGSAGRRRKGRAPGSGRARRRAPGRAGGRQTPPWSLSDSRRRLAWSTSCAQTSRPARWKLACSRSCSHG